MCRAHSLHAPYLATQRLNTALSSALLTWYVLIDWIISCQYKENACTAFIYFSFNFDDEIARIESIAWISQSTSVVTIGNPETLEKYSIMDIKLHYHY